ncbi:rhodanese-like domain-containing protein [Gordonia sp. ABSL1-1]|uniref:rhodanese-like domain-containing protein n=1 Tax=Gordonia sp. ABSL1-1 TaxID=3053923 RepID=UPI0025723A5A|nr:rhodanese-like domain-containing protein [Gordonia sp. ABSL1-1]MDL9938612.1 rhodanese-like domain-containing protein [Gordonia sp. ABSL1-1]
MSAPVLSSASVSALAVAPTPVHAPASDAPLSIQATDYLAATGAGAIAVDLRSHRRRQLDGALFGALAIDAVEILDRLTPGAPGALRVATTDARWVLVSEDGHEAEWIAWHLQARGVTGAVFVVGGHRRLRQSGINGTIRADDLGIISAHES